MGAGTTNSRSSATGRHMLGTLTRGIRDESSDRCACVNATAARTR
ncbi:hypothetical protein Pd630_LPD15024 (plasmid) [Rhodococcus opacus PD630]|nr:hypothetical protein Pd630_LPD15024 [Rhodococcus opacus PD630]